MGLFGKKKQEDSGLDVISEIKEPFSFANFFEDHVVERYKKIKTFLEEKGILFFLLSPFQQRNRLIVELIIIVFGVLVGVIPRSMNLVQEAKERNSASEMAALIDKDTQFTVGSIIIRPLASSQYEKQHLLAFYIDSADGSSVPSKADRYEVVLSAARGVVEAEKVSYAYEVLPVSENGRLLLVYADNREQNDMTGIYNLWIHAVADDVTIETIEPMEIVLSNTQETNDLFGKEGINLASLTEGVLNDENTPIADGEEALEKTISDYELEVERISSLPLGLTPQPSLDSLETFCEENRIYPTLTDTSTTKDLTNLEELPTEEANMVLKYDAGITMGSVLYRNNESHELTATELGGTVQPEATGTPDGTQPEGTATPEGTPVPEGTPEGTPAPEGTVPVDPQPAAQMPAEGEVQVPEGTPAEGTPVEGTQPEGIPAEGQPMEGEPALGTEQVTAPAEEVEQVHQELEALQGKLDNVLRALMELNHASQLKYDVLKGYKLVLNRELDVKTFPETRTVDGLTESE